MQTAVNVERTPVDDLVGVVKSFGPHGPKYEVLRPLRPLDGGDWMAEICLVQTGEITEYELSDILTDPEAL